MQNQSRQRARTTDVNWKLRISNNIRKMVGETSNEGFLVIVDIVIVVVVGKRISGSVLVDGT